MTEAANFEQHVNNNIIFTGAGFSKDFGGLLAKEIWCYLFNTEGISQSIKQTLCNCPDNYENAFAQLTEGVDKKEYNKNLLKIFNLMDGDLLSRLSEVESLSKIINKFINPEKCNFTFTLNQDLLLERYFMRKIENNAPITTDYQQRGDCKTIANDSLLHFPYIDYDITKIIREISGTYQSGHEKEFYSYEKMKKTIKVIEEKQPETNKMNYVKLHGSFNWEHSDGFCVSATGDEKLETIEKNIILNKYLQLFKEILSKKKKILCIGYGFADNHINEVFVKSIEEKESELFLILPETYSDFIKKINNQKNDLLKKALKKGISGFYSIKLNELLKPQSETHGQLLENVQKSFS